MRPTTGSSSWIDQAVPFTARTVRSYMAPGAVGRAAAAGPRASWAPRSGGSRTPIPIPGGDAKTIDETHAELKRVITPRDLRSRPPRVDARASVLRLSTS